MNKMKTERRKKKPHELLITRKKTVALTPTLTFIVYEFRPPLCIPPGRIQTDLITGFIVRNVDLIKFF